MTLIDQRLRGGSGIANKTRAIARRVPYLRRILEALDSANAVSARAHAEVARLEDELRSRDLSDKAGYCHCCRQNTLFETTGEWLRDHYLCGRCLSLPRQRHLQMVLDVYFPGWEDKKIHESSPSNAFIADVSSEYSASQFFPGVRSGEYVGGVRCEDLQSLTFVDEVFDIFITQDVFEHVLDPRAAAREVLRVLKPGGMHVFTAPRRRTTTNSYARVDVIDGIVTHLLTPEYHGSPIGDGRALVTWDYGLDFEEIFAEWSGGSMTTFVTRDTNLGLDGAYIDVFVNRKSYKSADAPR